MKKTDALLALLLATLSLLWSAVAISNAPTLTRYDEWTYIDYARKVSQGHIPVKGETLADQTLEDWSCRGMEGQIKKVKVPPCGSREAGLPATSWPYKGENYNAFHPPLYFAVAGYGAVILEKIFPLSFVTSARIISALFVCAGVVALFFAIRSWRVGRKAAFAGAMLALATPAIASSATIVHNDSITLLAGAAAVWMGARIFLEKKMDWYTPALLIGVIVSARTMSAAALISVVGVVVVAIFIPNAFGFSKKDRKKLGGIAVAGVVATLLPYGIWAWWQGNRGISGYVPDIKGVSTTPLNGGSLASPLASLADPYGLTDPRTDFYLQPELQSLGVRVWAALLFLLYMTVPFIALLAWWKERARKALALATAAGPGVAAGIVQTRELLTAGAYFRNVSGRYALSNAALHAGSLALLADKPRWRERLLAFAMCGYTVLLASAIW